MHHGPGDMDHMLLERIDGKSRIAKALCLKYEVEKFLQIFFDFNQKFWLGNLQLKWNLSNLKLLNFSIFSTTLPTIS